MTSRLSRRWIGRLLALDLVLLAAVMTWVLMQATPSSEAVRLRNALLFDGIEPAANLNWSPTSAPADFRFERHEAPPSFRKVLNELNLDSHQDEWSRAMAIARHLQVRLDGKGPIMAGLEETYGRIVDQGEGYCGDFADVFSALARADGIVTRQWNFSFDGYGGHGHIFNEIWDGTTGKWRAIDVFNNYLFLDGDTGEPLSALEFRSSLRGERPAARISVLNPQARPGYAIPEKALDYYQRGAQQWYLWWGNNVITVDQDPWVRLAGRLSRHLEQLAAILVGVQPALRVVETPESAAKINALLRLRSNLILATILGLMLAVAAVFLFFAWRYRRHTEACHDATDSGHVKELRLAIIGPLPPPPGGMANQCRQLFRLLQSEGVAVELVQTNAVYRPAWVSGIPVIRAGFRLIPYLFSLWRAAGRNQIFHVFANSGWAWHLFAAPAMIIARWRGVLVIVNYRGGNADAFLISTYSYVQRMMAGAAAVITPSEFLRGVFAKYSIQAQVIPNIVDLERFNPDARCLKPGAPHLIVTRNLEAIYDIPTAIRSFALIRSTFAEARMTVAGTGPELSKCEQLAANLGVSEAIRFAGRIDNDSIASLYACADVTLNPSTIDNMPISILEAYASGVPVVTTNVGGIPFIAEHEHSALLVSPGDPQAMAIAVVRLLTDHSLAERLVLEGKKRAQAYAWSNVRDQWLGLYRELVARQVRVEEHT